MASVCRKSRASAQLRGGGLEGVSGRGRLRGTVLQVREGFWGTCVKAIIKAKVKGATMTERMPM